MLPGFDPNQIKDLDKAREAIGILLNLVEELKQENMILREQVQELRDEVNRLKGEQGKPPIKPGKTGGGATIHRSKSDIDRRKGDAGARPNRSRSTGKKS